MKVNILKVLPFIISFSVCADIAVIVHPSNNNEIDQQFIKKVFTGKVKSFDDGSPVVAINQESGNQPAIEFNEKILNKSASQLKAYWSKQLFTGKGTPPKEMSTDSEVLKLIGDNPSLIGYVDASAVNDKVKVIGKY